MDINFLKELEEKASLAPEQMAHLVQEVTEAQDTAEALATSLEEKENQAAEILAQM